MNSSSSGWDSSEGTDGWDIFSDVIGWTYFLAWSVSFYPQVYTNWRRKKVTGLSFDFELYNVLGFSCLAVYYSNLAWNAVVRAEYADRFGEGKEPQVAINDPVFAYHALLLTLVHWFQIAIYDRGCQKVSYLCLTLVASMLIAMLIWIVFVAAGYSSWLDLLYFISYVKVGVTLVKYIPQAVMNYLRKSTVGWNIANPILDLTGGTLSVLQLIIDSWVDDDWSAIVGNITKFLLGFVSIFFDLLFMFQHYVLYRNRREPVFDKANYYEYEKLAASDHDALTGMNAASPAEDDSNLIFSSNSNYHNNNNDNRNNNNNSNNNNNNNSNDTEGTSSSSSSPIDGSNSTTPSCVENIPFWKHIKWFVSQEHYET